LIEREGEGETTGGKITAFRPSTSIGSPDISYYYVQGEKFPGMETQLRVRINVKKFNKSTRERKEWSAVLAS